MGEEAQKLLKELLDDLQGCVDPNCASCQRKEQKIRRLAELLGTTPRSIMPWFLTEEARKRYVQAKGGFY